MPEFISQKPDEYEYHFARFKRGLLDVMQVVDISRDEVVGEMDAAFELIEAGDPTMMWFIECTYGNQKSALGVTKDQAVLELSSAIFHHAAYLAVNYPTNTEAQTIRLKGWLDNLWGFSYADSSVRLDPIAKQFNNFGLAWQELTGMPMRHYGKVVEGRDT